MVKNKFYILNILYAIVESDYLEHDALIEWADNLIGKIENPQNWLVEVSLSKSKLEILDIIKKEINNNMMIDNVAIDELYLGMVYKEYLTGKINFETFKNKVSCNYYSGMGVFNEDDINLYFLKKQENINLATIFETTLNEFLKKAENALSFFYSNNLYLEIDEN